MAPSVFKLPSPGVDALGGLFDVSAASLQARHVRHDQLVRVSLFFRERRPGLDALGGIGNRAIERGPSGSQAKRRHHQARVAEHGLRLIQSLAFHAAHQPVGIHIDVVERKRGRIAEADAVLVFRFVVGEALGALLHDEPTRAGGRIRQNRVSVGHSAVADPLLAAVDLVAGDAVALHDRGPP